MLDMVADRFADLAGAVLAGRRGETTTAATTVAAADAALAAAPWVRNLGRRLVAEAAIADRWGDPAAWLRQALTFFEDNEVTEQARACRSLLSRAGAPVRRSPGDGASPELARLGITSREADVLALLADGRTNKEIAARLYLSRRTVEKHVERLMAKTATSRRTRLTALATRLTR